MRFYKKKGRFRNNLFMQQGVNINQSASPLQNLILCHILSVVESLGEFEGRLKSS